jgi:capsule polysaccharide export protein KpsE/RkpR
MIAGARNESAAQIAAARDRCEAAENALRRFESDLQQTQQQSRAYAQQVHSMLAVCFLSRVSSLSDQLESLQTAFDALKYAEMEARERVNFLEAENESLLEEHATLKASSAEAARLRNEIADLHSDLAAVNEQAVRRFRPALLLWSDTCRFRIHGANRPV